jgi:hypothetical protein
MSQTATNTALLPVHSIAMNTSPLRQIRPISEEGVNKLMEESDPKQWDRILVRPYPAGEPYPVGEEGRPYQLIADYHCLTAARRLEQSKIRAIVRKDVADDKTFLVVALSSNLRHSQQMTREDQITVLRHLREAGMSERDLEKQTGIPRGTIHNWLSGRDTNAGRQVRNAPPRHYSDGVTVATIGPDWDAAASGGAYLARKAGSAVSDFLAGMPGAQVAGADVAAWAEALSPHEREARLQQTITALEWLGHLRAVLRSDEEASDVAANQ